MAVQTKAVFLHGKPTKSKKDEFIKMQTMYANLINLFINRLVSDDNYYLDILNNNKKASNIRALEKGNRSKLGSALGQNAVDHAVTELHNHFIRIKNYLYGVTLNNTVQNYFVSSTALFNACITGFTVEKAKNIIQTLFNKTEDESKKMFYSEILDLFQNNTKEYIKNIMVNVRFMFLTELSIRKIPFIKNVPLQLDARLCTLEKAKNIKADYVLSVKSLTKGKRVQIPLITSQNSIRRLNQYGGTKTVTLNITNKGVIIAVPIKKKIKNKSKNNNLIGIDIGITDLIYNSEEHVYGSYSNILKFYNNKVMPEDAKLNKLRGLMKKYQKELRNKNTHPKRKEFLRQKICNINTMIQQNKKANRIRRSYKHLQNIEISKAVKEYFKAIKNTDVTTVIEDIDITKFDMGKKANRSNSMWIRGKLHQKLEDLLTWHGFKIIKVDPAYTSKLCPICSNIDNDNRKGKTFQCTQCGHTKDADYNASINIKNRASDKEIKAITEKNRYNTKKRHEKLKSLYAERNAAYKANTVA